AGGPQRAPGPRARRAAAREVAGGGGGVPAPDDVRAGALRPAGSGLACSRRRESPNPRIVSMLTNAHSLPARLKEATAPLHDSVERALPLAAPGLTLDAYRRILAAFLGFYVPLEAAL